MQKVLGSTPSAAKMYSKEIFVNNTELDGPMGLRQLPTHIWT